VATGSGEAINVKTVYCPELSFPKAIQIICFVPLVGQKGKEKETNEAKQQ